MRHRGALARDWQGLALGALALTSALLLSGCHPDDGSFTVNMKASPLAVLTALEAPELSQLQSQVPEAQIIRSRPSDSELLYTMPGDQPDQNITVRFTMTPTADASATGVKVDLHVPPIEFNAPGKHVVLREWLVETALRGSLTRLAQSLERHDNSAFGQGFGSNEFSTTLVALAIVNHKALVDKIMAGKSDDIARRWLDHVSGGDSDSQTGNDSPGEGHDPTPHEPRPMDVTPDNDAQGVDPTPYNERPAEARPMIQPTGTSPTPDQ